MPAAGTTPGATVNGDRFARVPMGVVLSGLDDPCVRLYAWLAGETYGQDWWRTGTAAAKALGWQSRTVRTHALHLKDAWLIAIEKPSVSA